MVLIIYHVTWLIQRNCKQRAESWKSFIFSSNLVLNFYIGIFPGIGQGVVCCAQWPYPTFPVACRCTWVFVGVCVCHADPVHTFTAIEWNRKPATVRSGYDEKSKDGIMTGPIGILIRLMKCSGLIIELGGWRKFDLFINGKITEQNNNINNNNNNNQEYKVTKSIRVL